MNGIALTVILSQIPKLLGFSVKADGPLAAGLGHRRGRERRPHEPDRARDRRESPRADSLAEAAAARPRHAGRGRGGHRRGRRVRSRSPRGDLRAGSAAAGAACAAAPAGAFESLVPIVTGGIAVALVAFADTSVLSRTYAARLRTPVDPNQEMVGLGVANIAAGFFQGFPISSSSSRTPVAEAAGARDAADGGRGRARDRVAAAVRARAARRTCRTRRSRPSSSRPRSASSRSRTCGASIASSAGSSGCRWSASRAWRCSAPFRASPSRS